jgi:Thiamine pyrophosphate-requiring enzymes [acetolactate synthase, pyruvate dehydrogenase (cytochrome), glyoxylate carboligase, phosphonopyruvate decarboxylase]
MASAAEIIETLRAWDIPYVFCCPGTSEVPLLDALAEVDGQTRATEFLLTTHEAISVSMADGFSRASGGIGVAYLHTNVGLANGLAHLYAAQVARSSVALLTGIKGTKTLPHRALTTSPRILETAAPYAGRTWQNLDGESLVDDIERTLRHTTVAPESPAVLTIPQNHISGVASGAHGDGPYTTPRSRPSPGDLGHAVELLRAAHRPVIVAGSDVARRGAQRSMERIAEALGAPVYVESRRDLERWSFRSDHPNFAGLFEPRSPIVGAADLLFLAGAPTPLEFSAEMPILPARVPLLHLTEDAAEAGRRIRPAGALVGDTALALAELDGLLAHGGGAPSPEAADFLARARRHRDEQLAAWHAAVPASAEGGDFSAATAMRVLAESLAGEGLIVLDGVTSTLPLLRFLERTRNDTLFATASGSLGWGMGAAAGVALARKTRTIAVVGDGVVQFGVPAFWTVRRYGIPVTYLVVNNGRYQAVISGLRRMDGAAHAKGDYPLTDISGVDIAALAASFGIPSERVSGTAGLARAIGEELSRGPEDGPRLVEIMVNDTLWQ